MKKNKLNIYHLILLPVVLLTACSKEFLRRPPKDAIVDAGFYKTDDQLMAATALLYSKVWSDYNGRSAISIGDFRAGTAYSGWNDKENVEFNTTANTLANGASWRSFFIVIGQSNLTISNINKYAGPEVSPAAKRMAIAEARFMRALAYRYLVMNWGEVPIIEDNLKLISDTSLRKNTVESVWKFVISEMRALAEDLPEAPAREGRITKWTAEGMLARFYLTRSGLGANGSGARSQSDLDSAKYFSQRVITKSKYALLRSYYDLFLFPYDNNTESMFSLQWVYAPNDWGASNAAPSDLNYDNKMCNGDGWGGDKSATWWMIGKYEGFVNSGDTLISGRTLDQRLKATFFMPGAYYPEITEKLADGTTPKLIYPYVTGDNNFLCIKKYVTGRAADVGGQSAQQNYGNDTYMMRLSEMYLIYAEAVLGNSASTTDATALEYFNAVHTRAGLPRFEKPLTADVIFNERIVEFAMEGMAWYDLVSLHYYNKAKTYAILNAQDRGLFATAPDKMPDPTSWKCVKTSWASFRKIVANDGNFLIPIPAAELSQAPNLKKPAVDYYNK
ncbi:RagB/SusD family nutrient uptake outer membrane protein [Chitinophaga sp.]|uniref:RagB/SusD family nutrient uptake outer membrane protein n=1 Tax=Chitinophaga sp. TaxID=1869181 RepID=UPI002C790E42|nr:RagB/SusD family nutrient uptake outer membrane protein [Chitinophaga sp.]HWV66530.1 RagB/SusD family nutrient uptake outer membrane protein [Chitinophaga sp.]